MQNLRALRRHRSLTFLDLATLTGIPARQIAEVEYGLRQLGVAEYESLAFVLGLEPHDFTGAHRQLSAASAPAWTTLPPVVRRTSQTIIVAALATAVATGSLGTMAEQLPRSVAPVWALVSMALTTEGAWSRPLAPDALAPTGGAVASSEVGSARDEATLVWQRALVNLTEQAALLREAVAPPMLVAPMPADEVAPAPAPVIASLPAFMLTEQGPFGCPVKPVEGRVVLTQGYGVGSHAPAEFWGAVDLAVDGDGDGDADVASSWYVPIVATHDGQVTVNLDTDPAGNHVWVNAPDDIWRTGYSHLALVTVISGQFVRAGEQIGLMGSTGRATGPHLDYQVWRDGANIDPTALVGCR